MHTRKPARFTLAVRVPAWAVKPTTVLVNRQLLEVKTSPDSFLKISHAWHEGDAVAVTFPMSLHFEPIEAQTPNLAALMYGPLLLVALADAEANLDGNPARPGGWIRARADEPLTFQTPNGAVMFRPFYLIQQERYTTYCRLASAVPAPGRD